MTANPTLSIILPVRDGGVGFRRCLGAVIACDPPATEVVVVDDGSHDDSAAAAEAIGARVLRLEVSKGPAYARNRGAELATGDILFFVDADVVLPPDATARVLEAMRREPRAAAVFGSYDDMPAAPNFLSQYKNLLHHHVHQMGRVDASTFWAGCGAVRREVFAAIGGFDESYERPSIEDIELGTRLRRAGHSIHLSKDLQAKHLKRWTLGSLLESDIRDRALPWTSLLLRTGNIQNDLNLSWAGRLSVIAAYLALASAAAGLRWPNLFLLTGFFLVALLGANATLYRFFARKRGIAFAAGCVFCHWLYYLYGGAAFAVGLCSHLRAGGSPPPLSKQRPV